MIKGVDKIKDRMLVEPTIRSFKKSDLREIMNIERQSFTNPWSPNMFEALYQINPGGFYVAQIDDVIVGYAIVLTEISWRHWSKKRTAHLINLAVHPRFRNQGIGKNLISKIIFNIERTELQEIYLEVRASNTNALAFYTKLGFNRSGLIKMFYGDEDAIVMAKKIS